ncbi:hypothetical protein CLM85_32280 [Streptomyces albidoflavus]|nr:hypothetical protein CLM85_32280 [Streptomyces albidoflavus]PBO26826.1 hypothetical protein CLM84_29505 [Streptomyces albidoflavus]
MSPELMVLYEQRAGLPVSVSIDLLSSARERIQLLVYAALFPTQRLRLSHFLEGGDASCLG